MFKRMQAEIEELQPPPVKEKRKKKRTRPKKDSQGSPEQTSSSKSPKGQTPSPNKESFFLGNRNYTAT